LRTSPAGSSLCWRAPRRRSERASECTLERTLERTLNARPSRTTFPSAAPWRTTHPTAAPRRTPATSSNDRSNQDSRGAPARRLGGWARAVRRRGAARLRQPRVRVRRHVQPRRHTRGRQPADRAGQPRLAARQRTDALDELSDRGRRIAPDLDRPGVQRVHGCERLHAGLRTDHRRQPGSRAGGRLGARRRRAHVGRSIRRAPDREHPIQPARRRESNPDRPPGRAAGAAGGSDPRDVHHCGDEPHRAACRGELPGGWRCQRERDGRDRRALRPPAQSAERHDGFVRGHRGRDHAHEQPRAAGAIALRRSE
jgi:hypothetical protein